MKKSYEEYKEKMLIFLGAHREEATKIENRANELAVSEQFNKMFSDYARQQAITNLKSELEELNDSFSDSVRDLVKKFCKEFSVSFKEDNADHTADIANALKVIEMCGTGLTGDLLRLVIEPLKGSYKALKVINDVLAVKWRNTATVASYAPEIRNIISDYMGSNDEINQYVNLLKEIEAVADYPQLSKYEIVNTAYNGAFHFEVHNKTSYAVDILPDEMVAIGKRYETLAMKYPLMFANYIPTQEEIIDDTMKNQ